MAQTKQTRRRQGIPAHWWMATFSNAGHGGAGEARTIQKSEADYVTELESHGFRALQDGSGVIVIGERDRVPVDRHAEVTDSMRSTRARRFDSARAAVEVLCQRKTA